MRKWQLQALAWTFSAFLPKDSDGDSDGDDGTPEDDYYALLGISRSAKADDIRRAYKKKSLQLHPDKIAQRAAAGNKTEEEIRRDFQKVKEAYETLSDPQKRELYDGLGPLGMKFINNPQSAMDPHTLLDNLSKSSFCDRTKLFGVVLTFTLLVLMQPILICSKIDQDLRGTGGVLADSSWMAVLVPLWFLDVFFLIMFAAARVVGPTIKLLCAIVLEVFLALKWDGTVSWSYAVVLIPLYLLEVTRLGSCLYWVRKINADMLRMVTIDMLEEDIIPRHYSGRGDGDGGDGGDGETKDEETGDGGDGDSCTRLYADLTEEERDEINNIYIIVHVPPDVAEAARAAAEHDGEEIDHDEQIAHSPECKAALEVMYQAFRTVRNIIVIHVTTIVLLVLKADGIKNYSWWIVSVPLWVQIGFTMISSCLKCCTAGAGASGEEELLVMQTGGGRKKDDDDDNDGDDDSDSEDEDENDEPLVPPTRSGPNSTTAAAAKESPKKAARAEDSDEPPPLEGIDGPRSEDNFAVEEAKVAVDEDALKSMKISELKAELAEYSISTASFVEKSEFVDALAEARANGMPKSTTAATSTSEDKPSSTSNDDSDDDESSGIYIDEETFKAWASAQAANEAKASEIAAKACSRCCEQVFWAMMLALFVAKLAGEDVDDGDASGSSSFSTFWILFPFLLVAGLFLCCCCCSIYCASNVEDLEENMRQSMMRPGGGDDEENPAADAAEAETEAQSETPFIPMPPPQNDTPNQAAAEAPETESKHEATSEAHKDDAQSEASDDLD
mmetsp:Transcript_6567/g.12780  ORF Transcript_6567/g.12780 Transcript_6567/m.12780 type:complete len:787 (+) Transcript_6567:262-2622(+)